MSVCVDDGKTKNRSTWRAQQVIRTRVIAAPHTNGKCSVLCCAISTLPIDTRRNTVLHFDTFQAFKKDVLWRERLYYKIKTISKKKKHLCSCSSTLTPIKAIKRSSHVSVLWCYRVIWYNYDLCTISPLSYRFSWSWHTKTDHFWFYLSVLHAATWALCDDNDDDIVGGCMKVNRHQLL